MLPETTPAETARIANTLTADQRKLLDVFRVSEAEIERITALQPPDVCATAVNLIACGINPREAIELATSPKS